MAKHKSRKSTWMSQGNAAALTRFGPELSALTALRSENVTDYHRALHQATAGRMGEQAAVASAIPQLAAIYKADEANRQASAGLVNQNLAGLGPAAGAFKVAANQEAGGALAGLSGTVTQALGDLVSRGVRASESETASRRTALQDYRSAQGKVNQRHQDLLGELGAFATAEGGRLADKAAQRDLQNRISLRSDATRRSEGAANRQNARTVAKIRKAPDRSKAAADAFKAKYGVDPQTRVQHNALRSKVDSTVAVIKDQLAAGNSNRSELGRLLTLGRTTKKVIVNGQTVALPAVSKVDPLIASVALDVALGKHVSPGKAAELHRRGYSVRALGLPSRPPRRKPRQGPPAPAGPAGPIRT